MKKLSLLLSFLFLITSYIKAQDASATPEDIQKFLKSKTYVVKDPNIFGSYNRAIQEAMEKNWTITDWEFIDETKFAQIRKSYRNSFIRKTKVTFTKDKSKTAYTFLSLLLGDKASSMKYMPDICSFPLSYYGVDHDKYLYKLGAIVKFMQNHVKVLQENPNLSGKNVFKYYMKNLEELKGKTLYLLKEEVAKNVNTPEKIKNYYSGKIKFVTEEEIKNAILTGKPDVVFLHLVKPPEEGDVEKMRIYKAIMGAADGKLYYFGYHKYKKGKYPDAFLASDFKKLSD